MDEILVEFSAESKLLISEMLELLDRIESDISLQAELETYGQRVDRIMGAAKNLVALFPKKQTLSLLSNYCELCKLIGYKASQVKDNEGLLHTVIAFLLDATEMLMTILDAMEQDQVPDTHQLVSTTFLDRLKWLSKQFDANLRGSVAVKGPGASLAQSEIDDVLKKLGLSLG